MLEAQVKELLERITVLQQTLRSEPPERVTQSFETSHPTPATGLAPEPTRITPAPGPWFDPTHSTHISAGRYAYVRGR